MVLTNRTAIREVTQNTYGSKTKEGSKAQASQAKELKATPLGRKEKHSPKDA